MGRIVTMPFSDPDSDPRGAIILGAGVAWRDITPGVHLTMFGWAREPRGLDQLLGIFRTVRFLGRPLPSQRADDRRPVGRGRREADQ